MKRNKGYQFRAYELEGAQGHEKEQPQIKVVAPKPTTPPRKHPQESSGWQVEAFLDQKKAHGVRRTKPPKPPKAERVPRTKTAKKAKPPRKRWFTKKERPPEVSPMDSGATTLPDILAPASTDFRHRDYVVVDGICHSYLYITGYGYTSAVTIGWLNPLVEMVRASGGQAVRLQARAMLFVVFAAAFSRPGYRTQKPPQRPDDRRGSGVSILQL